jgi:hypothetical protein
LRFWPGSEPTDHAAIYHTLGWPQAALAEVIAGVVANCPHDAAINIMMLVSFSDRTLRTSPGEPNRALKQVGKIAWLLDVD